MKKYFDTLNRKANEAFSAAEKARAKGLDPVDKVETTLAKNMAERVEGLISIVAPQISGKGIPERILELEKEYGKLDWRVAFKIAEEVTKEKFCKFKDKVEAMEIGVRVGIAYVTNGVVASPLEGFTSLKIRKRKDGKEYLAALFSGPIRSAGGTGASVSVLIVDYIRKVMGYDVYDPTEQEAKRASTELIDYHERITNLQYLPSSEETEFMWRHLPVQIDGEPSEKIEVSNYKDLNRIETNLLRSGFCLTLGEGLTSKAPKLWARLSAWGKDFGMEQWNFLKDFLDLQKSIKAREKTEEKIEEKVKPDYTFIKDIVAGRPVLTYPLYRGGFRLRYGRCRSSGLSSMAIHPATMVVLNNYIAIGTQLKVERPGKSTVLSVCDTIDGPIVKLKNGNVVYLENCDEAKEINNQIEEILFLGDVLVSYGDFWNRGHILAPPGFCEEWWAQQFKKVIKDYTKLADELKISEEELRKIVEEPLKTKVGFDLAIKISKKFDVSLYPKFTFHWNDISVEDFLGVINWIKKGKIDYIKNKIILPLNIEESKKRVLEEIGLPHKVVVEENIIIEEDDAKAFILSLGLRNINLEEINNYIENGDNVLDVINKISGVSIKDKSGISIGARMGRPEKAKMRVMTGKPHMLFPVGEQGGKTRSFQSALNIGEVKADFPVYFCEKCKKDTIYGICEDCYERTKRKDSIFENKSIDIKHYFDAARKKVGLSQIPDLIKGVRGTGNAEHDVENVVKGIFRAIHNLNVNKDGTVRYDMTEMAITHFKPKEVGTSIKKLKELGYEKDIDGRELTDEDQIIELKVQDIILPACDESDQEGADIVLFRIANFVDDLLEKFYGIERFYNLKTKKDLVGHLVMGIAPHTSAGIVGRIIGFSKTQGCYARPMWHCAFRRDCDGDECAIILLMDCFLNFSRKFLPLHRGAKQDAPLVLTTELAPSEVDDMVFDMDIVKQYPLEFYEACEQYKMPWDVKIEKVNDRLGGEKECYDFGFTHGTNNINAGVRVSAYKFLPTMMDKVRGQMALAEKIRAVDTVDVARLVIERHFIRDIKGNLRKFSMQQFRCVNCNSKYRRPPLIGQCLKCGGKIIFTISQGSIIKYLIPSLEIAKRYELPDYLKQTLELTKDRIDSVFGREKEKQEGLVKWFG